MFSNIGYGLENESNFEVFFIIVSYEDQFQQEKY